ncbi:hypothetical protein HYH02_000928 [Chlamydomonas schloesseri]|uniref:Uncharacterized protein n=1 Tax=Chlamydomonas schloesseri TaxID=2026947 RepID=A0A836BDD8_9CHLO|nr:hypothetical protein HYH02_000928 [Chlamydomonas schloesseri]|eukprot:KAG2455108.1 hypothetical protein HYH02_000928 [Chlamydomonas schloesseri]
MVSIKPELLGCPIAALRARAAQLAEGLSDPPATASPRAGAAASAAAAGATTGAYRQRSHTDPSQLPQQQQLHSQPPAHTGSSSLSSATSPHGTGPSGLLRPMRPASAPPAPPSIMEPPSSGPDSRRAASGRDGPDESAAAAREAVTAAEAMELLAAQPALLAVQLPRLLTRCREMGRLLAVRPAEACRCLCRLPPAELERVLAAPLPALRRAWLRLAAVVASLEMQEPTASWVVTAAMGSGGGGRRSTGSGPEAGQETQEEQRQARRGQGEGEGEGEGEGGADADAGADALASGGGGGWPRGRAPSIRVDDLPEAAVAAARRMVLLCPQLLMASAPALRASAQHLGSLLELQPARLRTLLARRPRLLLLPAAARVAALQALATSLQLHGGLSHAARLAVQQPLLLGWEPVALDGKLAELGAALGLGRQDVGRLCRNQPALLAMAPATLAERLQRLQALLQLPDLTAARRLAREQPGLLSLPSDTAARKLTAIAEALQQVPLPAEAPAGTPGAADGPGSGNGSGGRGGGGVEAEGRTRRRITQRHKPVAGEGGASSNGGAADQPRTSRARQASHVTWGHSLTTGSADPASTDPQGDGAQLQALTEARRLVQQAPTLLTMRADTLPRRATDLADALGEGGGAEVEPVAQAARALRACPQLLVLPRSELRYRVQQLSWVLEAPPEAVRGLVLSRPEVLLMGLREAREVAAQAAVGDVGTGTAGPASVRTRAGGAGVVSQQAGCGGGGLEEGGHAGVGPAATRVEDSQQRPAEAPVRGPRIVGARRRSVKG